MPKVKLPRTIRDLVKKAKSGCGEAAWEIAAHYCHGTGGVGKNDELARQWLTRAAELGDADAQCSLGVYLANEGEYDAARKWFERAAAQGHIGAMYDLGNVYDQGHGVELNKATAAEWFRKAALKGFAVAQNSYGYYLSFDMGEHVEAMTWFEKAAAQGNVQAMRLVGMNYGFGLGVLQ